jgi:hypothetical protein
VIADSASDGSQGPPPILEFTDHGIEVHRWKAHPTNPYFTNPITRQSVWFDSRYSVWLPAGSEDMAPGWGWQDLKDFVLQAGPLLIGEGKYVQLKEPLPQEVFDDLVGKQSTTGPPYLIGNRSEDGERGPPPILEVTDHGVFIHPWRADPTNPYFTNPLTGQSVWFDDRYKVWLPAGSERFAPGWGWQDLERYVLQAGPVPNGTGNYIQLSLPASPVPGEAPSEPQNATPPNPESHAGPAEGSAVISDSPARTESPIESTLSPARPHAEPSTEASRLDEQAADLILKLRADGLDERARELEDALQARQDEGKYFTPKYFPPPPSQADTGHYDDGHSFGWQGPKKRHIPFRARWLSPAALGIATATAIAVFAGVGDECTHYGWIIDGSELASHSQQIKQVDVPESAGVNTGSETTQQQAQVPTVQEQPPQSSGEPAQGASAGQSQPQPEVAPPPQTQSQPQAQSQPQTQQQSAPQQAPQAPPPPAQAAAPPSLSGGYRSRITVVRNTGQHPPDLTAVTSVVLDVTRDIAAGRGPGNPVYIGLGIASTTLKGTTTIGPTFNENGGTFTASVTAPYRGYTTTWTFEGVVTAGQGIRGVLTIGGDGKLPGGQPIVYNVEASKQ